MTQYFCVKSIFGTIKTVFIVVKVCIYVFRARLLKLKRLKYDLKATAIHFQKLECL